MELQARLSQQRVQYIVSSYQLAGNDEHAVQEYLATLLAIYPAPLIELALVETLIDHWLQIPLITGVTFLSQAHQRLRNWEFNPIASTLTPDQFQAITGLDPHPVFGPVQHSPKAPVGADPA
jgi:hypothetical protein